ncbi:MAG: nickel insertion protein [Eubacterium ramulus]
MATGLGAGKRQYRCPGILRAMLICQTETETQESDRIWRLETDIDDCSGEAMGHVMQTLLMKTVRERYTIHRFL